VHNGEGLIKVENESRLFRDPVSKSVINKDDSAYNKYLQQRQRLIKTQADVEKNTNDISNIKEELCEIKGMLATLVANIQK
jgi:hypothetical protein